MYERIWWFSLSLVIALTDHGASQAFSVLLSGLCVAVCGSHGLCVAYLLSLCGLLSPVWALCVSCVRDRQRCPNASQLMSPIILWQSTMVRLQHTLKSGSVLWANKLCCGLVFEWPKNGHRRLMFGDTVCISVRLLLRQTKSYSSVFSFLCWCLCYVELVCLLDLSHCTFVCCSSVVQVYL